jgi:phage shock protein PspC (stress-responsive transcriptional regulator)
MRRIATTVSLGRSTLQVDEHAFARLESYLATAASSLGGNPDRDEILNDLEQAIADRCLQRLVSSQSIVTRVELDAALNEVGQVDDSAASAGAAFTESTRRLEQIGEGAVISGVCLGIARYFNIEPLWVRIITVVLTLVSGFTAVLIYALLMLLLPFAPSLPGSPQLGKIPAKSRQAVNYIRSFFEPAIKNGSSP